MESQKKPAVVLATHTMGLAVIRALGEKGVPVIAVSYDRKHVGNFSRYVRERVWAPHPEKQEGAFLDLLTRMASRFGGALLIPVSDETLSVVSRNKTLLERSYVVAAPEWAVVERLIDKKRTYELARACGVPVPRTVVPRCLEEAEGYGRAVDYPCLVKPQQSHRYFDRFRRKMVRADNIGQLLAAYREARDQGLEVMLQEFIPGDDSQVVNYNSYFWDGEPLVEFTAQQIRKAPRVLGSPCVVVSRSLPEVIGPGRTILRAAGFRGYSCAEFKRDPRDGVFKLMEINGRHNLSGLLAVRCGINFPWIQYRHLMEGMEPSGTGFREGVYWIDFERDVAQISRYRRDSYPLRRFLQPYVHRHVFAVFDWRDPFPFLRRWAGEAGDWLRKKSRRGG
jgi:predicted ATP-grasp superfamily ATP-dependent carboligase